MSFFALNHQAVSDMADSHQVFGLQVAVRSLMRALFTHAAQDKFPVLVADKNSATEVLEAAQSAGLDPARLDVRDLRHPLTAFKNIGTLFRPDPSCKDILWQREVYSAQSNRIHTESSCRRKSASSDARQQKQNPVQTENSDWIPAFAGMTEKERTTPFSFCGLAHAIAGRQAGEVLQDYILAPAAAPDAIICPSHAVKSAIANFFDIYGDYIGTRFGSKFKCSVELPVIPLGVDIEKITVSATPDQRVQQRKTLGASDDEIVILWVGRLSHAIKAHPLAMFRAVEQAARTTNKKIRFVMQGYFVPDEAAAHFRKLADDFCQSARVEFIASNDARFPNGLWGAGDIFFALIDNMQESFGLTPIEAIAAGLPRVLSDWDGYRDSVQDGIDGFLIPTILPPAGAGGELAALTLGRRANYGEYLAKTALLTVVDHDAAAQALIRLIENPDLRARIAAAAKKRLPDYQWRNIIPQYENLWRDQAARRATNTTNWPAIPPQTPDPFAMYQNYSTRALSEIAVLRISASAAEIDLLRTHEMNRLADDIIAPQEIVSTLLKFIADKSAPTVREILSHFSTAPRAEIWRTLTFLIKMGILSAE